MAIEEELDVIPCPQWVYDKNQQERESQVETTPQRSPQVQRIEVYNPRWEHVDTRINRPRPHKVSIGDELQLSVDTKGVPDGSEVTFHILDSSMGANEQEMDSVSALVSGASATVGWTMWDTHSPHD